MLTLMDAQISGPPVLAIHWVPEGGFCLSLKLIVGDLGPGGSTEWSFAGRPASTWEWTRTWEPWIAAQDDGPYGQVPCGTAKTGKMGVTGRL